MKLRMVGGVAMVIDVDALVRLQDASLARAGGGLRSSWPPESAMDAEKLRSFFAEHPYCVLATTSPQGRPVARPVAFTVLGASFWFATVAGSRLLNLERTPWASLVVETGDSGDHQAGVADGPATIIGEPSKKLLAAWDARHGSHPDWASAWFEIQPTRMLSYSARRMGEREPQR